ncbi:glycosyltransferase family 2 protein [Meridianimaribacter flavus]|uniref:Glycosyl transferase family 2 n=1 Tax=Meridianimaribacter flavus TaxID=571115 RepID=A0ABY2G6M6_9FLAO|nr:glycosyltransferase family 2 protein [Meridianimaribacter flavus]TDY12303.1 glycosyl transferase family 2 [Meridianimaribacter flavus]
MTRDLSEETLVVVPAYNAHNTIHKVIEQIFQSGFKEIIISDDCSAIPILPILSSFKNQIILIEQPKNLGYGGNQKFLYEYALKNNYNYIVMIHGDLQYTPTLIPSLVTMLKYAKYDFVFGSRILGGNAIKNGMPIIKYIANRCLTLFQNILTGYKLSEYHSGLRAYNIETLKNIKFHEFSNNFIFDNQMLLAIIKNKYKIGEVSCTTKYDTNSSSISYKESTIYAFGVIKLTLIHFFKNIL